ncbi:hypothetical protein VI26_00975 [Chromobacterium sp. LK1]|uniref:polyamine ABC transporter substrate-binding protein n=1 Tax=Chromobacterium sp. LK1 TaxID=1628193 RepID=UPI0006528F8D|nr:polyamine ABC transporter substrate-binding protein [Chromobacterium sp. LK1]KMN38342.1 hypothetical protein VI26_00975 [Chromobacterium sp. LK1]
MWRAMVMGACLAIWTLAAQAEEQNVLNVYNWSHYIGQRTLQRFERETGIKVRYDVYDSNEILQGKLLTGRSGYDVVGPSMSFLGNQLAAGAFQSLDKSKLPNYRQLDPALLRQLAAADPGNRHAVPYLWGTSSVAIDEDRVRQALGGQPLPADALALLFDPAYAAKLSGCGIAMMISPSQVVVQALIYLGKDPALNRPEDLPAVAGLLRAARPHVRVFTSAPINDLVNGEVCVAMIYSGDAYIAARRASEAKSRRKIRYLLSSKGAELWMDTFAIPKDAPHPDNAHRFIDFMMRPEVMAEISNELFYPNAVPATRPLLERALTADRNLYPDAATMARLRSQGRVPPALQRERVRLFNQFKNNSYR